MTYSERDLSAKFELLTRLGCIWTHLGTGSPTYGRPWAVYRRDPETGGRSDVRYIGTSRREAFAWLTGAVDSKTF